MIAVTMQEAAENLPELIAAALRGETVRILVEDEGDTSYVQLVFAGGQGREPVKSGSAKGQIWIADDFDAPYFDGDERR